MIGLNDIKILYAASNITHMENFHGPYIRWLAERGCKIYSLCGGRARLDGIYRHIDLGFKKSLWSPDNFLVSIKLAKIIRTENFSLIWVHTSLAAFFVRLAVMFAGKKKTKVINTVHGYLFDDTTPQPKRTLMLAAEKLTAGITDLIMTMNSYDYKLAVSEKLGKKVVNIDGIGLNFSKFISVDKKTARGALRLPENAFIMIYAAEFSERKNQSFLIKNIKKLPPYTLLVLPGQGIMEQECRELAASEGVSDRVIFAGQIKDLSSYYSAADICVSSSRSEGLPFNILEALYYSLPVVATSVKGHVDLITQGENGFLYEYNDGDMFSRYVKQLAEDEKLRDKLGKKAHTSVDRYSLNKVLPVIVTLLPI
jgi:glycosyltransferase involved in cell wall biosynthesis